MSEDRLIVSEGEPLAGLVELHLGLEAARVERSARAQLTALLSVPVAFAALWPSVLSEVGRRAVLTFWAFAAIATVWAAVVEWRLWRRAKSLLSPSADTPPRAR